MTIYHDFNSPTGCCNRPSDELPIGDGRTSATDRVTCDGTFEPAVWAHELYPHPSEHYDEPPKLDAAVRHHLARAIAMYPPDHLSDDGFDSEWMDRINLMLTERSVACLVTALHRGLSGQAALDWAHAHSSGEDGELMYDLAIEYGVEVLRIKPYGLRKKPAQEPVTSPVSPSPEEGA